MNLLAFYAVRGYSLQELGSLTRTEKLFLCGAREMYYREIGEFLGAKPQ